MTATTWLQYFCCTHSSPQPGTELLTTTSRRSGKVQGHSSTHQSLSSCLSRHSYPPHLFFLSVTRILIEVYCTICETFLHQ